MQDPDASTTRLRLALRAARQGAWEFDLTGGRGYRSPELQALLGVQNEHPSLADYLENVHPEDRPLILQAFGQLRGGELDESVLQYRFLRDDGGVVWVEQHTFVERDAAGQAARLYGLTRDITVIKQNELDLQHLNATLETRVAERTAALTAFADFTEAVGAETDLTALIQQAVVLLQGTLAIDAMYLERADGLLRASRWTEQVTPDLLARAREGFTLEDLGLRDRGYPEPVFVDAWDGASRGLPESAMYRAVAWQPVMQDGQVSGLLVVASRQVAVWPPQERSVVRAVGRGLSLATQRAEVARQLQQQNAALDARSRALEGFTDLTRDLALEGDPLQLVGRAQEIVLALLPTGVSTYYELQDGVWQLRSHRGHFQNPALLAALRRGIPQGGNRNIDWPFASGEPYYQDQFDPDTAVTAHEQFGEIRATASFPVLMSGEVRGILAFGLHAARAWSPVERAVMETSVRNLGLALERARSVIQLARRNEELSAANQELEAFTYSVSHDLMTPVRHVSSFAELALKSVDDPARTRRYLDIMNQAARRMASLIEAMLTLSRQGRTPLQIGWVPLGPLMEQARRDAEGEASGWAIEWRISPLPTVRGDQTMLQQVLSNLVANAVKYSRNRAPAVIAVWAQEDAQSWTVFVRDNGVGFDPRYAERLFGVFQRLHRQEEFEGTGVGLANVRRIVTRHGGTVHAESSLDGGATFSFTLPKEQDAALVGESDPGLEQSVQQP